MRSVRKRIEQVLDPPQARDRDLQAQDTDLTADRRTDVQAAARVLPTNQQLKEIKEELGLSKGEAQTEVDTVPGAGSPG